MLGFPARGARPMRAARRPRQPRRDRSLAKLLFIKSYGCQMNVYDAGRMADVLAPLGYTSTDDADGADVVILNTCHIREKAAEKVYSEIGRLRARRGAGRPRSDAGAGPVVVIAGCVAQAEGAEVLRRAPWVDVVVGPQAYHRLPALIARARAGGRAVLDTEFPAESKFDHLPEETAATGPACFLTIQEGCDKFCSFCVVPYTRGAEFSRPAADVLAEAGRLVAAGAREITLLGQNVNAYHGAAPDGADEWGLARLIRALAGIESLERIRYTTSHPNDMDEALIATHAEVPELMPYLHLPVQSGSDAVLAAMGRRHSAEDYLHLVERLRAARPDLALSSDFIVGHPGETEADFAATLALVRAVGYAQAYSFKFSARPGTPAAGLDGQIGEAEKSDRLAELQALLSEQQRRFNEACRGRRMPVLFDRRGRRPGQVAGRSPFLQAVHVDCGEDMAALVQGRILEVAITQAHPNSLQGSFAAAAPGREGAASAVRSFDA